MRFGRRRNPFERRANVDRLVGRTRNRLATFTLLLVIALVSVAGLVTAAAAIRTMDSAVDRNLRESAAAVMAGLVPESESPDASPGPGASAEPEGTGGDSGDDDHPAATARAMGTTRPARPPAATPRAVRATPVPAAQPTHSTDSSGGNGREPGDGSDDSGGPGGEASEAPERGGGGEGPVSAAAAVVATSGQSTPAPSTSAPSASPSLVGSAVSTTPPFNDEHVPLSADTFFLILDGDGRLVNNPQNVALHGLPDPEAVASARQNGEDLRTTTVDGTPVRLLTQPIEGADNVVQGYLQSAIVLSLLQSQEAGLWQSVLVVTLVALLGAAAVTLLVTHRALAPIRQAFATERRFVAAASHELRTPIAVIRASAEILTREHLVVPGAERFVDDVMAESDRLGRQVADLLMLSSLQAGALTIRPAIVELQPFLHVLAGRASTLAAAHDVTIEVDAGTSAPTVAEVDPERLEQLLMILIDNAIDHSPAKGTVRLILDVRPGARDTAAISVVDHGPGIPPQERKRVFEPFSKLPRRRRTGESTGLGLAIAKMLADRIGATVSIGDAPGGGAVLRVTLRLLTRGPNASAIERLLHRAHHLP